MFAANPVRGLAFAPSILPKHGGTDGNWVDLTQFAGPVTALVIGGAVGANRTITFQGAPEDPASIGSPKTADAFTIQSGGFCDSPVNQSVVIDKTVAPWLTDSQQVSVAVLRPGVHYARAIASASDDALTVIFVGKARNVAED